MNCKKCKTSHAFVIYTVRLLIYPLPIFMSLSKTTVFLRKSRDITMKMILN